MRNCRICDNKKFKTVMDFGKNPLVNSLVEKRDLKKKEPTFPLVVEQCQKCFLTQIVGPIDSDKIYKNVDYLYFSGDMPGLSDYFQEYAEDLKRRFVKKNDFVVEIGSNDGLMLEFFKDKARILGVDPASNVVARALYYEVPTLSDSFGERIARSIEREFGKAKLVYGNNCIAHIHDLHDVLRGVKLLLKNDGVFVVECNYWGGMVKNKNYGLIYHDHFSYFTLKNWDDLARMYGMYVIDGWVTPAQGGSLRVFLSNKKQKKTRRCEELFWEEAKTRLNSYETCVRYREEVLTEAKRFGDAIKKLKKQGKKIAGYGAAAKGFSILKLAGIDQRHLDYFVDDSPAKQGKYAPVSHIPVIARKNAKLPDYFVITAPNYAEIIKKKEVGFTKKGGIFLEYGRI